MRKPPGLAAIAAVGVLAGCAQLAGIDDTSGSGLDATSARVSLQLQRVSIGATVERSPAVLTGQAADYLVADPLGELGTRAVPATVTGAAMDTFTADLVAPTPIRLMLPSLTQPVIIDLPTPMVHAFYAVYEHRDPTPAPAPATITVAATSDVVQPAGGGSTFQFYSVGTWARRDVTAPAMDTTALGMGPVPWSSFVTPTGAPATDALTAADPVFLLRYEGASLAAIADVTPFAQTGTDTVSGTLVPVSADQTLAATVDSPAAAARFGAVMPAVPVPTASYAVTAAPGALFANQVGPQLVAGPVAVAGPAGPIGAQYGNPFAARSWRPVVTLTMVSNRTATVAAFAADVALPTLVQQVAEAGPGLTLDLPAPLPTTIAIDGIALAADGMAVAKPTAPVSVTVTTGPGAVTLYVLDLIELTQPAASMAIEQRATLTMYATSPMMTVPAKFFEAGKHYVIRAITIAGSFPLIATGELTEHTLPLSLALHTSGVFEVMP